MKTIEKVKQTLLRHIQFLKISDRVERMDYLGPKELVELHEDIQSLMKTDLIWGEK